MAIRTVATVAGMVATATQFTDLFRFIPYRSMEHQFMVEATAATVADIATAINPASLCDG